MKRICCVLILTAAALIPALSKKGSNPFLGRWDLDVTAPNATYPTRTTRPANPTRTTGPAHSTRATRPANATGTTRPPGPPDAARATGTGWRSDGTPWDGYLRTTG